MRQSIVAICIALAVCSIVVMAQAPPQGNQQLGSSGQIGLRQQDTLARPTPRRADGRVDLGPLSGEMGMWLPFNGGNERLVNPDNITPDAAVQFSGRPQVNEGPCQPLPTAFD